MNCRHCGHANAIGSVFCAGCLQPTETAAVAAVATPAAVMVQAGAAVAPQPARVLAAPTTPQPRLIVLENAQPTGQVIPLPAGPYVSPLLIGRNDLAGGTVVDVDVTRWGGFDKRVSRRHARLLWDGGGYRIEDWESAHGTWVNKGKLVRGVPVALASGDEVRLAELVARFEIC